LKLIYIVSGIDSAFSSQVIALVNQMAKYDEITKIDLCIGLKKGEPSPYYGLDPKIQLHSFRRFADYPFLINQTAKELSKLLNTLELNEKSVIHTRNELTGWMAKKALTILNNKETKLLIDVRGAIREELNDFFKGSWIAKKLKLYMIEQIRKVYQQADAINTVSDTLKKYLMSEFLVQETKIFTIPCCANHNFTYDIQERKNIRNKYEIEDKDKVIIFASGGINAWQNAEENVLAFADKGFKVFNLSRHAINHPNVISTFVPYAEMPKYLSAADVGVIFRDRHVVNQVASPIKFAEYLACGLPIIANDGVDQIVEIIGMHKVGIVVKDVNSVTYETVENLLRLDLLQIAMIGSQLFGIENISRAYLKIYQKLLGKNT
jgi:glycosyltransferase involved in cell wall biosynthesis